jgi:hypothetical protein
MSYTFEIINNSSNSYLFKTSLGIGYEVKFKPSAYILGDDTTPYADYIFEFIIELIYNPLDRNPPLDNLMSDTIAAIMIDFYNKKNKSVCIYICDSSDGRQELRRRKFEDWFNSQNNLKLFKFDEKIVDSQGIVYPLSAILRKDNPFFHEIIDAFIQITAEYSKENPNSYPEESGIKSNF